MKILVILLSPMAPHICEEIWERTGHSETIFNEGLPVADDNYLKADTYTLVIQVNGKIRSRIDVEIDLNKSDLESCALDDPRIRSFIEGKTVRKVIAIPGKLVNIVAN